MVGVGCLGQPDAETHPCEQSTHCIYDAQKGESNCKAGYTWEDPSDSSNYECVKDANCVPTTCLAAEVTCGNMADGCGATLDCGGPCPEPVCGNGAIEEGEVCDDGNNEDNDYCSADCLSATGSCGDSTVQNNEDCDDGNAATETCAYGLLNCDVCDASCRLVNGATSFCGDNMTDTANGETCDDGNTEIESCDYGQMSCQICDPDCRLMAGETSYCGDGIIDETNDETCDDNNGVTETCEVGETSCEVCDASCQLVAGRIPADGLTCDENGECIYTDLSAGLDWQGCPAGQTGETCTGNPLNRYHQDAAPYCESLSWGGYDDWVLPTIDQLRKLIRGCDENLYGSSQCTITHACSYEVNNNCTTDYCSGCSMQDGPAIGGCYWPVDMPGSCDDAIWSISKQIDNKAFRVHFEYGNVGAGPVTNTNHTMRCVRSVQ